MWGELVHLRASTRRLGGAAGADGPQVVVGLGYGNRGTRANLVNRQRVRAAVRTFRGAPGDRLVFSGGPVHSPVPEAELMAHYAREELGVRGEILVETRSRNTRENVRNVVPLLEGAARIALVSNPLHGEYARAELRRIRPDLAERLVRADDYRVGEQLLLKPVMAVIGLRALRGLPRP
ncbi:YdcF family protein [Schumannella luteola]|nr:YdcF family protein [Schumannella luteola]